jgi:hypothetical protein
MMRRCCEKHVISKNGFYLGSEKVRFPNLNTQLCMVFIVLVSIGIGIALGMYK